MKKSLAIAFLIIIAITFIAANRKVSDLTELTSPEGRDLLVIVDSSGTPTSKKLQLQNIFTPIPVDVAYIDTFGIGTTSPENPLHVAGNAQFDGDITDGTNSFTVSEITAAIDSAHAQNTDFRLLAAPAGDTLIYQGELISDLRSRNDKKISIEFLRATNSDGLHMQDDAGNYGVYVQDATGYVGIGMNIIPYRINTSTCNGAVDETPKK